MPPATTPEPAIRVLGGRRAPLSDFYHVYLRLPWPAALLLIVSIYLGLNCLFACAYLIVGGVEGVRPGVWLDTFYFSIQTMGTIGYGAMHPVSGPANALVAAESVTGLIATAVATGLVFAKFAQSRARLQFTTHATIAPMDGQPTLMFRVGNERANRILEAQIRVILFRTERTREGMTLWRMYDLALSRDRSPAMARTWTVMHPITPASPLYGQTPASLRERDVELMVALVGVDDTSLQPVHARTTYSHEVIVWGARHADVLRDEPDGTTTVDLRKFHHMIATEPTPEFPYPKAD